MLANNETGTIHPVAEISRVVKQHDAAIIVHTDASQAVSKHSTEAKRDEQQRHGGTKMTSRGEESCARMYHM